VTGDKEMLENKQEVPEDKEEVEEELEDEEADVEVVDDTVVPEPEEEENLEVEATLPVESN
jgi:hypothetical protein